MRPPFRSVSFPCLADMVGMLPPSSSKTLQRDCTSLRPSCWPLDLVGKCSLAPLARLGSVVSLRSPPSAFRSLRSFSAAALPALATLRPPALQAFDLRFAVPLAPLVRSPLCSEKTAVFSRKKSVQGERTFFPKMECLVFLRIHSEKHESKQILYITSL